MAVPLAATRIAPAQLRASHAASSTLQRGLGARGSSTSRRITTSVAAAPPATAVKTAPAASIASVDDATAKAATVPSCQVRDCSVRRIAAGTSTHNPKANDTASSRRSSSAPKPSGPTLMSCVARTGIHRMHSASSAAQTPAAIANRPIFHPASPHTAVMAAAAKGSRTGANSATEGMRPAKCRPSLQALDGGPQLGGSRFLHLDDLRWSLGHEGLVGQLGFDAIQLLLQLGAFLGRD